MLSSLSRKASFVRAFCPPLKREQRGRERKKGIFLYSPSYFFCLFSTFQQVFHLNKPSRLVKVGPPSTVHLPPVLGLFWTFWLPFSTTKKSNQRVGQRNSLFFQLQGKVVLETDRSYTEEKVEEKVLKARWKYRRKGARDLRRQIRKR